MQQAVKMLKKPTWVCMSRLRTAMTKTITVTPVLTEYSLCARDYLKDFYGSSHPFLTTTPRGGCYYHSPFTDGERGAERAQ